jgi:hypothetical protein
LTALARPRTVLVDDVIAGSLSSTSGFEMSPLARRTLRGIGPVAPWVLRRADQAGRRGLVGGYHQGVGRTGSDNPPDDNVRGDDMGEDMDDDDMDGDDMDHDEATMAQDRGDQDQ